MQLHATALQSSVPLRHRARAFSRLRHHAVSRVPVRCLASIQQELQVSRRHLIGSGGLAGASLLLPEGVHARADSIYDFKALQYEQERSLADFKNQNVNYPGLRTLYQKYKSEGFNVIAFPCNQFGGQAPGTSEEERAWAFKKFGFQFDVFDKLDVNGPMAHPLYKFLKARQPVSAPTDVRSRPNREIEWNYVKFLIDRNGQPVKRFKPSFDPLNFENDVRLVLAGLPPLPGECILHPGRKVCKVDQLLPPGELPLPAGMTA